MLSKINRDRLTSNLVDGLGKSLHVASGDTGHGDTAVLGGVYGVLGLLAIEVLKVQLDRAYLLRKSLHLLGLETGVCEHADLDFD